MSYRVLNDLAEAMKALDGKKRVLSAPYLLPFHFAISFAGLTLPLSAELLCSSFQTAIHRGR
jgi:hypothetical protein